MNLKSKILISTLPLLFIGCADVTQSSYNNNLGSPVTATNRASAVLKETISYMYDEERLAHDLYLNIYNRQPVYQLQKIASGSEVRHIQAVESLASKYGVKVYNYPSGKYENSRIQTLYNKLYSKGVRSKKDALEVGCMVEVEDVEDLNRYIIYAQNEKADNVASTFNFLRKGSYNHYWAFDRGLKEIGVSSGCCSLGSKYCHPEYPKKERGGKGRGYGKGRGGGHGMGRGHGRGW